MRRNSWTRPRNPSFVRKNPACDRKQINVARRVAGGGERVPLEAYLVSLPNERIHVLHLIGSTGLYGAERWILALMRAADLNLVQFTLINLVDRKGKTSEVVGAARSRGLTALDFYTGGVYNPLAALRLAHWAKQQKVHIVHGHGFKSDAIGLLAARLAGCRAMTTPHGWSLEKDWRLEFYEKLDRFLFRFMDAVCPLSPELGKDLRDWVRPSALQLINNGVDIEEVQAAQPARQPRPDSYVIGYIGRLIALKDLTTLLAGVRILRDEQAEIRLLVIGDGPQKNDLQTMTAQLRIMDRVEFLGFSPDPLALLKLFDVFVLPSLSEGIPRCVMEAMAAGVPVVVSDIPGNRTLVSHGETGLLFQPGDAYDLADKISALMNNPAQAASMADHGKRKVEEGYSSQKLAREYISLYRALDGN